MIGFLIKHAKLSDGYISLSLARFISADDIYSPLLDLDHYSLPTVQKMIDSLVIKKSLGTGIGSITDNSTNLYLDNLEKCCDGLCYVMWTRHS